MSNDSEEASSTNRKAAHRRSIASPIFTELPLPEECCMQHFHNANEIIPMIEDDATTAENSPFSESCYTTLNTSAESSLSNGPSSSRRNHEMKGSKTMPAATSQATPATSLVNILERIGQPTDLSTNNVIIHLRSTIANLLVDNDKLNEEVDCLSGRCKQLENERTLQKENITPENARLQTELNETRLREADLQLALEELKSRIDLTDKIVQSEPQLLEFFNSIIHDKIPPKSRSVSISTTSPASQQSTSTSEVDVKTLGSQGGSNRIQSLHRLDTIVDCSPMILKDAGKDPLQEQIEKESKKQKGLESPQSDSGLSSTHSASGSNSVHETSAQMNSSSKKPKVDVDRVFETTDDTEYFVLRRQKESNFNSNLIIRNAKSSSMFEPNTEPYLDALNNDSPFVKSIDFEVGDPEPVRRTEMTNSDKGNKPPTGVNSILKWRNSLKESLSWISKDTSTITATYHTGPGKNFDYKFEALAAKHGEARALAKLRTTQVELRRMKAKCQQFESHFAKQDENVHNLEQQLDEQKSRERKLKHEIRLLQRKIFQMEANHREFEVTQKIKEMELSSKLAEITFRITQSETMNQQITAWNQIKSSAIGDSPTPVRNSRPSVPYVKSEESPLSSSELTKTFNPDGLHKNPPKTLDINLHSNNVINGFATSPSESLNQFKLDKDLIESILEK